jgi:hypothetical protein
MSGPEQLFWAEVNDPSASRRSLAVCYALLISVGAGAGAKFWQPINQALNARLGLTTHRKLDAFRKLAWSIHDNAAKEVA